MDILSKVSEQTSPPGQSPEAWFADQVHPHDKSLKGYLRNAFPSVRDVEDVIQESYIRIWRIRATQTVRSTKDLLFEIARRVAIDIIRRERRSPVQGVTDLAGLNVLESAPNAAEAACTREELALLAEAIARLPSRCRTIIILRKIKRVPQKEIARLLGISEQTVQVQVHRGVKRCEEFFIRNGLRAGDSHAE